MKGKTKQKVAPTGSPEQRREAALEEVRRTMSKEELNRVQQMRHFDSIERGTPSYRIGLAADQLRLMWEQAKNEVAKSVFNIKNLRAQVLRIAEQRAGGVAIEEVKPGVPMNDLELEALQEHHTYAMQVERRAIIVGLWQARGIVGQHDLANNLILSEEDYDAFVESTDVQLRGLGVSIQ
jgi:hypothetical protein